MPILRSALLTLTVLGLLGCGAGFGAKDPVDKLQPGTYRFSPGLEQKRGQLKTIAIVPVRIDVIQISAGGVKERIDELSVQAQEKAVAALQAELAKNPDLQIQRRVIDPRGNLKKELEETYALFDTVSSMIIRHTYLPSKDIFPEKITAFDYSLGPDVATLADGADALLFVAGLDIVSSGGRKAAQAGMAILGLLGGMVFIPNTGVTLGNVALVDGRDGSLLAYKFTRCCGALAEDKGAARWVADLMEGFPLAPK